MAVPWWSSSSEGWSSISRAAVVALTGKTSVGQLAPFDLVPARSLQRGAECHECRRQLLRRPAISAVTLIALNSLLGYLTSGATLEGIVEGRPQVLIHNGKLYPTVRTARV
jgi:uncharacterized membrane protein YcaP (DUF421 family)